MRKKQTNIPAMTDEASTPASRYLLSIAYLSDEGLSKWKGETIKRFANRDKTALYYKYLNWQKTSRQIAVYTFIAYADMAIGKKFDCIFNIDNPDEYTFSKFELLHAVYEGWAPNDSIVYFHQHLCVFEFDTAIPEIIYKMHKEDFLRSSVPKSPVRLGFCQQDDFEKIAKNIKAEKEGRT